MVERELIKIRELSRIINASYYLIRKLSYLNKFAVIRLNQVLYIYKIDALCLSEHTFKVSQDKLDEIANTF